MCSLPGLVSGPFWSVPWRRLSLAQAPASPLGHAWGRLCLPWGGYCWALWGTVRHQHSTASSAQRPYDIHSSDAVESLVQLFSTVSVQYVPSWSKETVALLRKVSPSQSAGPQARGCSRPPTKGVWRGAPGSQRHLGSLSSGLPAHPVAHSVPLQ